MSKSAKEYNTKEETLAKNAIYNQTHKQTIIIIESQNTSYVVIKRDMRTLSYL